MIVMDTRLNAKNAVSGVKGTFNCCLTRKLRKKDYVFSLVDSIVTFRLSGSNNKYSSSLLKSVFMTPQNEHNIAMF